MKILEEQEILANEIDNLIYDYDTYEYKDIYNTREDGFNAVVDCLKSDKGIKSLTNYLIDIKNNNTDYEDLIKNVLDKVKTYKKHVHDLEKEI